MKTTYCWYFLGKLTNGYGNIYIGGKTWWAHQLSWSINKNKNIPHGKIIMHLCHMRKCVNPKHLKLGTYKENSEDARRTNLKHNRFYRLKKHYYLKYGPSAILL